VKLELWDQHQGSNIALPNHVHKVNHFCPIMVLEFPAFLPEEIGSHPFTVGKDFTAHCGLKYVHHIGKAVVIVQDRHVFILSLICVPSNSNKLVPIERARLVGFYGPSAIPVTTDLGTWWSYNCM
jgi:hypothetical protein